MGIKFSELTHRGNKCQQVRRGVILNQVSIKAHFFIHFTLTELEACDKPAKDIMEGLRKVLNKLAGDQKRVVMVYFMGYTKMVSSSLCFP